MAEPDRRVRRTRRILHEALISLILEQGYEQTTVQDILDRADVGRSTFYAHYRDKEALLVASFDDLRKELERAIEAAAGGPTDVVRPVAVIFDHAYRNRRVYRALCGRPGGARVYRHLHRLIGTVLREQLRRSLDATGSRVPVDLAAEFHTSAALGVLTWWIDQNFVHGPAKLAEMYQSLAGPDAHAPVPGAQVQGTLLSP